MITPENRKQILKLTISELATKEKNIKIVQQSKRSFQKRIK